MLQSRLRVALGHYTQEFLEVYHAVLVQIGIRDHLHNLLVRQIEVHAVGQTLEFCRSEVALVSFIEGPEHSL